MIATEHKKWLEERQKGIGGSDISAICGLNEYRNAIDVWLNKTEKSVQKEPTPAMLRGTFMENHIAKEYQERTQIEVLSFPQLLYEHPTENIFKASPDRDIDEDKFIEIKTTKMNLEEHTQGFIQGQWYCGVLGKKSFDVVMAKLPPYFSDERFVDYCLMELGVYDVYGFEENVDLDVDKLNLDFLKIIFDDIVIMSYERNDEFISYLQEQAYEFWNKYVLPDVPPPATNLTDLKKIYRNAVEEKAVDTDDVAILEAFDKLKLIKEKIKELEKEKEQSEFVLMEAAKDAQLLLYQGRPLVKLSTINVEGRTQVVKPYSYKKAYYYK